MSQLSANQLSIIGPRKLSTVSSSRACLTPAEKTAQDFIIAASPDKGEAIAKTFVGKMKIGVEGKEEVQTQVCTISSSEVGGGLGVLLPASDNYVAQNPLREEDENSNNVICRDVTCRDSDSINVQQPQTLGNNVDLEEVGS